MILAAAKTSRNAVGAMSSTRLATPGRIVIETSKVQRFCLRNMRALTSEHALVIYSILYAQMMP